MIVMIVRAISNLTKADHEQIVKQRLGSPTYGFHFR